MTYKITNISQQEDLITTTVIFDLDGENWQTDITHFRPASLEEIYENIKMRGINEQNKRQYLDSYSKIIENIPIDTIIEI